MQCIKRNHGDSGVRPGPPEGGSLSTIIFSGRSGLVPAGPSLELNE